MGMFACFATPAPTIQKQEHLQKVTNELTAAKSLVTQLQQELQQVHTDHTQLLQQVSKAPTKQDAATSMPLAVVEGQAKPPVILESKNPQPTGRQQHSITSRIASPEVAIKSRIPTHPAGISAENGSSSRAPKEVVSESPKADSAGFIRAGRSGQDTQWACHNDSSSLAEVAELEQRIVMLQQQHKVAEAFRASLEAQLRDARFANSSLQTQVLSLQTKFEKTVEEQVSELERLEMLCKDGQLRYDAVASELAQLKQDSSAAEELVACRSQLDAALSQVADREVQLVQVTSELHKTQQQLADVREQLATTQNLVEHMAGNAKTLAQQHQQQVEKVEHELRSQKNIYDSTIEEMLQLSNNYNELKQDFHKLQSQTKNHGEMVQLVQQELADLSYYAAAGRAALGIPPDSPLRNFSSTSEVLLSHPSDGSEAHTGSLKLSRLWSIDGSKSAAVAAVLASRELLRPTETATVTPESVVPVVLESDEPRPGE